MVWRPGECQNGSTDTKMEKLINKQFLTIDRFIYIDDYTSSNQLISSGIEYEKFTKILGSLEPPFVLNSVPAPPSVLVLIRQLDL